MRRLTHEEFMERVRKFRGFEYEVLTEYKGAAKPVTVKHIECGRVYETTPDKFYNGGCIECGYIKMKSRQRKTNEEFVSEVKELSNGDYEFLDEYVNNTTRLKVKHVECGHEYKVIPRDFLQGKRCPNCRGKRISESLTKTHEEFVVEVKDLVGDEYRVVGKYTAAREKIKVKHNTCGRVYDVHPNKFLHGNRCSVCTFKEMGARSAHTLTHFKGMVFDLVGEEFVVLGDYTNNRTKTKMKHNVCGYEWEVQPDSFLGGNRCPRCKESRGETRVRTFLEKAGYSFIREYRDERCKNILTLPFDFAIFDKGKLVTLIEFHGIQHYRPVKFFGGEEGFAIAKLRDNIKKDFCESKGIPLLEISYLVKDVEGKITAHLNKLLKHSI